jgi:hypothetical protein
VGRAGDGAAGPDIAIDAGEFGLGIDLGIGGNHLSGDLRKKFKCRPKIGNGNFLLDYGLF